jgi:hypothetical protein
MKPLWFLLWAIVIWRIAAWSFEPEVAVPKKNEFDRQEIADSYEQIHVRSRLDLRSYALSALELPWAGRCNREGRNPFIAGLNEYYYHRQNQTERYPETFGQAGADYIAEQWSTPDDKRIDRLTQEAYAKGYLDPADFSTPARKMIAGVVKDERITANGCFSRE